MMLRMQLLMGVAILLMCDPFPVLAQVTGSVEGCELPELRDELARRVELDQKARFELISKERINEDGTFQFPSDVFQNLKKIDQENTAWMKELVAEHGWLGKSLVGKEGAHNAWLLVQHADHDHEFQKKCLELMSAMIDGEVTPSEIAYLTDRVLVAEDKPQRYGTQCSMVDGKASIGDVEAPEQLDARRAEVGLLPIAEYLKIVEERYAPEETGDQD